MNKHEKEKNWLNVENYDELKFGLGFENQNNQKLLYYSMMQ